MLIFALFLHMLQLKPLKESPAFPSVPSPYHVDLQLRLRHYHWEINTDFSAPGESK